MGVFDLHHNSFGAIALTTQAISSNTTTVGAIIDTSGFHQLEFFIASGTITDGTYTITLEHGDDPALADAAVVPSELVFGAPVFVAANDNVTKRVGTISKKRYVRLSIVSTGVTTGGTLTAVAVQAMPFSAPVADQN